MNPSAKFIGLLVSTLLLASSASAGSLRWGVRAGLNASAFTGDFGELVGPTLRVAPNVAFVYETDFAPRLSLHGEVGYSSKGGKSSSEGTDPLGNSTGTSEDTWSFDYVEVPLLMRGRLPALNKLTPFAELGPTLGFALRGRFTSSSQAIPGQDFKSRMKALDLGFGAGLGLAFAAGPGQLGLEARYTRGLSDLFDLRDNLTSINQAWTFALSWMR